MIAEKRYIMEVSYQYEYPFERNKNYLGRKLLITHETSKALLNTKILEGLLKEMSLTE